MIAPLRVGIFVVMFPQRSETFIVTKVLKMLDAGVEVQIFALTESPHWATFEVLKGREDVRARVHIVPPRDPTHRLLTNGAPRLAHTALRHPRSFARFLKHNWVNRRATSHGFLKSVYLRSQFVGHELDILHIEFDVQGIGIVDLKSYLGCKILLSARGTFQTNSTLDVTPDAPDRLFRYVDGYHFISRFLEDNTRSLGLPRDVPTWMVEPAIDLSLFRPSRTGRIRGVPLQLISVGRIAWEKGYEFALDAVACVVAAGVDVQYTIYGAGPYEEAVRYAIMQLHLEGRVRLAGALSREEMPAVYEQADIMLHAALAEGFCNAVIEAQAMELPVVTSDAGGLPENIEDGVTGFVVPRRDADAMAAKIIELARDPDRRKRFGEAGRARALLRFDLNNQALAFVRLYRELASLPARAPREAD